LIGRAQRPIGVVPSAAVGVLALGLVFQVAFTALQPRPVARASALEPPPAGAALALLRGFDRLPAAHLLILYLQAFDNQPGISIPFMQLDYPRVAAWLDTALQLDPVGQYPLLMASQLYAQVPDRGRSRFMLDFVFDHFGADPNRRWPWLAHGAIMAKHRLQNLPLALKFAQAIRDRAGRAPAWARQMHIFLLEDMGEFEAARILLGGLLASGTVTDSHERLLLLQSLERIQAAEKSAKTSKH
jgi:hypothetical protein